MPRVEQTPVSRARQLRWVVLSFTFLAVVETLRSSRYFYAGSDWRSFSFEMLKLLIVITIVVLAWRPPSPNGDAPAHVISVLKVSLLGLLMSFLTDEAFLQAIAQHKVLAN